MKKMNRKEIDFDAAAKPRSKKRIEKCIDDHTQLKIEHVRKERNDEESNENQYII